MTIANPGAGTYNVTFGEPIYHANNSTKLDVYMVAKSVVDAKLAELQQADAEATADQAVQAVLDAGTLTAVASQNVKYSDADADDFYGDITVTGNEGEFVVIFYAAENKHSGTDPTVTTSNVWIRVSDLVLTQTYKDINTALTGTNKFDTVTLLDDVDMGGANLTISTGATLDLNGNSLNAAVVVTNGSLVDSSNGAGSVSKVTDATGNKKSVLISDGSVVRAYNYTAKENGYKVNTETGALEFWFDADFDAAVYSKLTAANGITINAVLKVNGDVVAVIGLDDKVAEWVAQNGTEDNALGVSVTGYDNLSEGDTITVTPVFTDNYGTFGVFGGEIVYTVPAAE